MEETRTQFEADVQVGSVWRYIDRHGKAAIEDGRLILRKRDGEVIAEASMSDVWADVIRGSANVWLSGKRYVVNALRIGQYHGPTVAGEMADLARAARQWKAAKELNGQFLAAVQAAGGHMGRPGK